MDTRQKKMPENKELINKFSRWAKSHGLETLAESSGQLREEAHETGFLSTKGYKGAVNGCRETTTAYGF